MSPHAISATADLLSDAYLLHYPRKAGRHLSQMAPEQAAELLAQHQATLAATLLSHIPAGAAGPILLYWDKDFSIDVLRHMDMAALVALLNQLEETRLAQILTHLDEADSSLTREVRELLSYPANTAGQLMDTQVQLFHQDLRVEEVLQQLKLRKPKR
ncbi:MAG: hypothetical protein R3352_05430, partial [Salinisphaeraceae bacterium]|nr:hypothetical protein [Salinisphaeraceae bacterium]